MFSTLIDAQTVSDHLQHPDWVFVDCRFDLADVGAGAEAYRTAHLPGAVYAHLDHDLSGPITPASSRHPLPAVPEMCRLFGRLGISNQSQVVIYDNLNGAVAARLWWMLHYLGHQAAAVLDGGWQEWLRLELNTEVGERKRTEAVFTPAVQKEMVVQAANVPAAALLVDSRAPERYRGEVEPLDPVAGHIPGADNYFYQLNWGADGRYLAPDELRQRFAAVLGDTPPAEAVFYCGSGVTACANLLAMAHAGLGNGRLYAGSWSEWITDPARVVSGPDQA